MVVCGGSSVWSSINVSPLSESTAAGLSNNVLHSLYSSLFPSITILTAFIFDGQFQNFMPILCVYEKVVLATFDKSPFNIVHYIKKAKVFKLAKDQRLANTTN